MSRNFYRIVLQMGLLLLTFVARIQTLSTGGSLMEMLLKSLQVPWDVSVEKTWQKEFLYKLNSGWIGFCTDRLAWDFVPAAVTCLSNATPHWGLGSNLCMSLTPKNHLQGRFVLPDLAICYKPQPVQRPKDWQVCYQRSPCRKGFLGIGLPRSMRARKTTGRGWEGGEFLTEYHGAKKIPLETFRL